MSEVYYRIVGAEGPEVPEISVHDGVMTAVSRIAYLRRGLPVETGFDFTDLVRTAALLGCQPVWLVSQLIVYPGRGGITAGVVGQLLATMWAGAEMVRTEDGRTMLQVTDGVRSFVVARIAAPPRLTAVPDTDAGEECAICLHSDGGDWATAAGCDRHRFHAACISRWTGGACPLCRRTLR
jgi:hypothetical protein